MKKILHYILEARAPLSKPILMYHGTSSEFLRSILKHGLLPKTKEGRWVEEEETTSEVQRSRKSYGGVYFTLNLMTARSSATNYIIKKSKSWQDRSSNALYVCALIQPQAAIPDEDDYNYVFRFGLPEAQAPYILISERLNISNQQNDEIMKKAIDEIVKHYAGDISKRKDANVLRSLAKEVVLTEVERRLAHKSIRAGHKSWWSSENSLKDAISRMSYSSKKLQAITNKGVLPKELRIFDRAAAEKRAREALDRFIKKTKSHVKTKIADPMNKPWVTARIMEPVGFKGRNKIVCIVEEIDKDKEKNTESKLLVHYGTIPEDFLEQYRQRVGTLPEVVKK